MHQNAENWHINSQYNSLRKKKKKATSLKRKSLNSEVPDDIMKSLEGQAQDYRTQKHMSLLPSPEIRGLDMQSCSDIF